MSSPITAIASNASLEAASKIIDTKKHSIYPVKKKDAIVGIIGANDVVLAVNQNMKFHRNIQNVVLGAFLVYAVAILVVYGHILPI